MPRLAIVRRPPARLRFVTMSAVRCPDFAGSDTSASGLRFTTGFRRGRRASSVRSSHPTVTIVAITVSTRLSSVPSTESGTCRLTWRSTSPCSAPENHGAASELRDRNRGRLHLLDEFANDPKRFRCLALKLHIVRFPNVRPVHELMEVRMRQRIASVSHRDGTQLRAGLGSGPRDRGAPRGARSACRFRRDRSEQSALVLKAKGRELVEN